MRHSVIEPLEARIAPATLSISNVTQAEGDGFNTFVFTVRLDEVVPGGVTVDYETIQLNEENAAILGQDLVYQKSTLTFDGTTLEQTIAVTVLGDTQVDADRAFQVLLSNATGATIRTAAGRGLIVDDDRVVNIQAMQDDGGTLEGGPDGGNVVTFRLTLSEAAQHEVRVVVNTLDGTATAAVDGRDYDPISSRVIVFAPGDLTKDVTVNIIGDSNKGADETFQLVFDSSAAGNGVSGAKPGTVGTAIIRDDDGGLPEPTLSVEGPAGPLAEGALARYTFKLTGGYEVPVSITYSFGADGDTATINDDYTPSTSSQTLIIPSGTLQYSQDLAFIKLDAEQAGATAEDAEQFTLKIVSATLLGSDTPVTVTTDTALATIQADPIPKIDIADIVFTEGPTGTKTATFTVKLSSRYLEEVRVNYATRPVSGPNAATGGSAEGLGIDFQNTSGELVFAPNELEKTFTVTIYGDNVSELDELFEVVLSQPANGEIRKGVASATIQNDDSTYSILNPANPASSTVTLNEKDGTVTFTVRRTDGSVPGSVKVTATNGADAADGSVRGAKVGNDQDFQAFDQIVNFAVGETEKTITINLIDDGRYEGTEVFNVVLSNPVNGALSETAKTGVVTIIDDEAPPTISISDATVVEGGVLIFKVTLSRVSEVPIKVFYNAVDGTAAVADGDYTAPNASPNNFIEIAAGTTSKDFTIQTTQDNKEEAAETLTVTLSNPSIGTLGKATAVGTIQNDDFASVSAQNVSTREGVAGGKMTFVLRLGAVSEAPVSVRVSTAPRPGANAATAGVDYIPVDNQLITFEPGEREKTIEVTLLNDVLPEADESFFLNITRDDSTPNAVVSTGQVLGTILNDDIGIKISNVVITEGNNGQSTAVFTVTLDRPVPVGQTVTVQYATQDGTANSIVSGLPAGSVYLPDFQAASGTLTFEGGKASFQTVTVNINGDNISEADENFFLRLFDAKLKIGANGTPQSLELAPTVGTGTIRNDDANTSRLSVTGAATKLEGDAANGLAYFNFNLSTRLQNAVEVRYQYTVVDGDGNITTDFATAVIPKGAATFAAPVAYQGDADTVGKDQTITVRVDSFTILGSNDPTTITVDQSASTAVTKILEDDAKLTIADESITEGNSGTKKLKFTVTLSAAVDHDVVVNYNTADLVANATVGDQIGDYVGVLASANAKATIKAGETTATFEITINGDTVAGDDEAFQVNLANPVGAKLGTKSSATGTILNDDGAARPEIEIVADPRGVEGGKLKFTVKLSAPSDTPVSVTYETYDVVIDPDDVSGRKGAIADSDYTPLSTSSSSPLIIKPGQTSGILEVNILDDVENEGEEVFGLRLENVTGATVKTGGDSAIGTIEASDRPKISFENVTPRFAEGNSGTSTATFVIKLDKAATTAVDFYFLTENGTAVAGEDYTAVTGESPKGQKYTIPAGQTSITVEVSLLGDTTREGDETFKAKLTLDENSNAEFGPSGNVATATIADDDVKFTIHNPGNADSATVVVTEAGSFARLLVRRDSGAGEARVSYATVDGTAKSAGQNVDFRATQGTLIFADGVTEMEILVPILEDNRYEGGAAARDGGAPASENFTVQLSSPVNGVLGSQSTGTVQIVDNEASPLVIVTPAAPVVEGSAGTRTMVYKIKLDRASEYGPITLNYLTGDLTATAGQDYVALNSSITFEPGETEKTVTVTVIGDLRQDSAPRETFNLNFTVANGSEARFESGTTHSVVGTIIDDDGAPIVSISNASGVEGSELGFIVSLSRASDKPVTVRYYTVDGTAVGGQDFAGIPRGVPQEITFQPGETSKQIIIGTLQETGTPIAERDETFRVQLVTPKNATLSARGSVATGTIIDDDRAVVTVNDVQLIEGDSGRTNAVFKVTLSALSSLPVSFSYQTVDDIALAGVDYLARSGRVIIPANTLEAEIVVPVLGDEAEEFRGTGRTDADRLETFKVRIDNVKHADVGRAEGVATILDDDNGPTLNLIDQFIVEGAGSGSMTFTPRLTTAATTDVTFRLATVPAPSAAGVAQAGSDYTSVSGTFTIRAGELTPTVLNPQTNQYVAANFIVPIVGDSAFEATESFQVRVTDLVGAQPGRVTAKGTIFNDDVFYGKNVIKWTDQDGELVTLKVSKGNLRNALSVGIVNFTETGSVGGRVLNELNLNRSDFLFANVSITSSPQPGFPKGLIEQDGLVNVGMIRSNNLNSIDNAAEVIGQDLGVITVEGDLGGFRVGDYFNDVALKGLNVKSLGVLAPGTVSVAVNGAGNLKVAGDFQGFLQIGGRTAGSLDRLVIGGDLKGSTTPVESRAADRAVVGVVQLTGRLGYFEANNIIGGVETGDGSVRGNGSTGNFRTVKIHGDIIGSDGEQSGAIISSRDIVALSVGGSIIGGDGDGSGLISAAVGMRTVKISGDLQAGDGYESGHVRALGGSLNSVKIEGSMLGSARLYAAQTLGAVSIGGDVLGTANDQATIVAAGLAAKSTIGSVSIGGKVEYAQILGGYQRQFDDSASVNEWVLKGANADAQIGTVRVEGSVQGLDIVAGAGPGADSVFGTANDQVLSGSSIFDDFNVISRIARVVINGAVIGDTKNRGIVAQEVGAATIEGVEQPLGLSKQFFEVVQGLKFSIREV